MKKLLCIIIPLSISIQGLAYDYRKPLIQAASSDSTEYYAFLSINSDYMSFSDYQLLKVRDHEINDKISNLYLKAKQFYFEKKYYKSLKLFQKVVGLRNKFQLNPHSKKLVLNSILKLYELSSSKSDQLKYFKLLRNTYPYINFDDLDLNEELYKRLEDSPLLFSSWEISDKFSMYNYIIINGKNHEIYPGKIIKLPKNEFIVSLISNSFHPTNKILTKSELNRWEPNSEWLNSGACDNPNLKVNKLFEQSYIFYKHNCVIQNENSQKISLKTHDSNFKPKSINNLKPTKNYTNINYKPKENYKWIKNKWLWIGLGALATTIAISSNQTKSRKSKQTKKGF